MKLKIIKAKIRQKAKYVATLEKSKSCHVKNSSTVLTNLLCEIDLIFKNLIGDSFIKLNKSNDRYFQTFNKDGLWERFEFNIYFLKEEHYYMIKNAIPRDMQLTELKKL